MMISSEAVPYSKSGGLADVASSLSKALSELNNDVRLAIPRYGSTDDGEFSALPLTVEVEIGHKIERVGFKEKKEGNLSVYLVDHPWYSERRGIYGETSYKPYNDNLLRYTLLTKAVVALCKALKWSPQIYHGHDWTSGFLPYLVPEGCVVFTIHNLAYQGIFSRLDLLLADVEIQSEFLMTNGPEKRVNMLKAALERAAVITTVSPTYAQEIQEEEYGCGLDELLRKRSQDLHGILNGIDTAEWDPRSDRLLATHYSEDDLSGKAHLKEELQKRFNLSVAANVPLFAMVSRLSEQKGFVELLQGSPSALEQIISDFPLQFLIIGTGDQEIEDKLKALDQLYPNLSVNFIFSNEAAHLAEAGSDFFFMPSRWEPCGLNQMYSLRYGTIPVARRTGGLKDSIIDISEEGGTGILFDELTKGELYSAVERSVELYNSNVEEFNTIRKRGMLIDFSWLNSAQEYVKIYKKALKG